MGRFRVRFTYSDGFQGWTEAWYWTGDETTQLGPDVQLFLNDRTQFLSDLYKWGPMSVSNTANRRQSREYKPGIKGQQLFGSAIDIPLRGALSSTALERAPHSTNLALQTNVKLQDFRQFPRYLVGIPHGALTAGDGAFRNDNPPEFWTAWGVWRSHMLNGRWQIRARTLTPDAPDVQATGLVNLAAPNGNLQVIIPSAVNVAFDPATRLIHLHGFRRKRRAPGISINGKFYVESVDTVTTPVPGIGYSLRGTDAIIASDWKVLGKIQAVLYNYFAPTTIDTDSVVTHKRGRPFGGRHGRRLIRESVDP
jgi:hypothetical protein